MGGVIMDIHVHECMNIMGGWMAGEEVDWIEHKDG